MIQRVRALTQYLSRRVAISLAGALLIFTAIPIWLWFFPPTQDTPDADYFILLIGTYGAALTFLTTLSVAGFANRGESYPLMARLESRIEFLTAILIASIGFSMLIQLTLSFIIIMLPSGPSFRLGQFLEVPPVWVPVNILMAVLALHASDFVKKKWSRIYLFSAITILLYSQSMNQRSISFFSTQIRNFAGWLTRHSVPALSVPLNNGANWLTHNGLSFFKNSIGFVLWPFSGMADAIRAGGFNNAQAMAPAILMLYATILFMLAADVFAGKNLHLVE